VRRATQTAKDTLMFDLLYLVLFVALFASSVAMVRYIDRL